MPVPPFQDLMLPILELGAAQDTFRARGLIPAIAERFDLTEADLKELLPSGGLGLQEFREELGSVATFGEQAFIFEGHEQGYAWSASGSTR